MRYLLITPLLAFIISAKAQSNDKPHQPTRWQRFNEHNKEMMQRHQEKKESEESQNKPRPYTEFILNGGAVYPLNNRGETRNGALGELGMDVILNRYQHKFFFSAGGRFGLAGFPVVADSIRYNTTGGHGAFIFGANYMTNPTGNASLLAAIHIAFGARAQSNGPIGNPYGMAGLSLGISIMQRLIFNVNADMLTPIYGYNGDYLRSRYVKTYSAFILSAGFRISLKRNEDE